MNILIVDDDPFVCTSLQTILSAQPDIDVLATGCDGKQAIALYERFQPDVALLDIQMQPMSGLAAAETILRRYPQARILFLTTFSDDDYVAQALCIGARGYLIKQNIDAIAPALRSVMSGQSVFGGEVVHKLHTASARPSLQGYDLTEREIQIIEQVAQGLSNREIAQALHLSEGTVRNYVTAILDKLQLRDRTQLVVFYYRTQS